MNFNTAVEKVLKQEGVYSDDPNDSGGETKYGISKKAFPHLDIKNLTLEQAKEIYKLYYWDKAKCNHIRDSIKLLHFSCAVNCGVVAANKIYQRATNTGIKIDGILGPVTLDCSLTITPFSYLYYWLKLYNEIVIKNPSQIKYLKGWINRIESCL
jgi:lysozyme family protein